MGRVRYTVTGGQLSDFVLHYMNCPDSLTERCLDAPRIAASVFYDLGGAKLGNFLESCTIVG